MGITPAWAGKSRRSACSVGPVRDHPRVGGEKVTLGESYLVRLGSPPRGRGKDLNLRLPVVIPGITPAWAGKSCMSRWSRGPGGDHPRVGGEK